MPHEYRIGRLAGRYVVTWWEGSTTRRYRLAAQSRKEAETEAIVVIRRETVKPGSATVKTLWDSYCAEKVGRRVASAMKYEWSRIGPHFGSLLPHEITVEHSRAYVASRRGASIQDGTIWTELGHLRTVLKWAEQRNLIDHAPYIERPAKPAPKDRWLTTEEIETLLSTPMAPHILLAIRLMLGTAGRVTAILELTWDRVDFERNLIDLRLPTATTRKGRAVVPMPNSLRTALWLAQSHGQSDYVVEWAGQQVKRIKTGFMAAVEKSGLEGVSPHVLRHTAAVHMAAAGIPMNKISQYLGHSSTAITERVYARFAPDHLRDAANVLDFGNALRIAG